MLIAFHLETRSNAVQTKSNNYSKFKTDVYVLVDFESQTEAITEEDEHWQQKNYEVKSSLLATDVEDEDLQGVVFCGC